MKHSAEAAHWDREWAVRFYDGHTTKPSSTPDGPQKILSSYRSAAPYMPVELVSRLITPWMPVRADDKTVAR